MEKPIQCTRKRWGGGRRGSNEPVTTILLGTSHSMWYQPTGFLGGRGVKRVLASGKKVDSTRIETVVEEGGLESEGLNSFHRYDHLTFFFPDACL